MALPLTKPVKLPLAEERRRHQRVKVNLLGRYMLADRREFPCQVIDMSPGGMALVAPIAGQTGERVIAYVDHLGRLEGKIARMLENGFAMTHLGDAAQARQACRAAHLARKPADPQPAGRPPPWPLCAAQRDGAAGAAERHQCRLPRYRLVAVWRRDRHLTGSAAGGRRRRHRRQDAGPRRPPYRRRLRHRIHAPAAPRFR